MSGAMAGRITRENVRADAGGSEPDVDTLAEAVAEGDIRVLLMVLVHLTGDLGWLQPPFRPRRDVRLIADPDAGLPGEVLERIRAAVVEAMRETGGKAALRDPGDELIRRMMSVCLGEDVPPEYAPMVREEMALVPRHLDWRNGRPPREVLADRKVLIVGAGVFGIALAVQLDKLGIPFEIVEKNEDIGGTWHENRYPGCGVDTPNHAYSFSFGPRYRWSRYFSPREEIEDYLHIIVERYGLRDRIRFNTRLTAARWDAEARRWRATLEGPEGSGQREAWALVSAIGQLNDPAIPNIAGLDDFAGPLFHSSQWPDDLDIGGKRLAVIGTGATAMQLVPSIADEVDKVTVYQRSPQWAKPVAGYTGQISQATQWLLEHLPYYAEWYRFTMLWRYGDGLLPLLRKDPDWPHKDRSVNKANDRHREEMIAFIKNELGDRTDLLDKCVPAYPPYGKRILIDNGWFRTLRKPSVELVTDAIERIVPEGVVTADGRLRAADVVVLATGFRMTEMSARLGIVGEDGRSLADVWADDNPTAHLGMTVPGFPNLFCMLGPGSGLGHGGSAMFQAECQVRYIASCLAGLIERGHQAMTVHQSVHDDYVRRMDDEHEQLIWTHPGMTIYYRNKHGRVFSVMPWRLVDYWAMTHDPDFDDYRLID